MQKGSSRIGVKSLDVWSREDVSALWAGATKNYGLEECWARSRLSTGLEAVAEGRKRCIKSLHAAQPTQKRQCKIVGLWSSCLLRSEARAFLTLPMHPDFPKFPKSSELPNLHYTNAKCQQATTPVASLWARLPQDTCQIHRSAGKRDVGTEGGFVLLYTIYAAFRRVGGPWGPFTYNRMNCVSISASDDLEASV